MDSVVASLVTGRGIEALQARLLIWLLFLAISKPIRDIVIISIWINLMSVFASVTLVVL